MKFVLDTDVMKVKGYSPAEILYMLSLYCNNPINDAVLTKLHHLGLIAVKQFEEEPEFFSMASCYITDRGGSLIQEVLFNSGKENEKGVTTKDNVYDMYFNIAKAMQEIYPSGKKAGTNYQWRDSATIIASRLKKLFENPACKIKPEKEAIVAATKAYVQSFNGNYTYMQLLKYFISKKISKDGQWEESSQLLAFIENAGQENHVNRDWTSILR